MSQPVTNYKIHHITDLQVGDLSSSCLLPPAAAPSPPSVFLSIFHLSHTSSFYASRTLFLSLLSTPPEGSYRKCLLTFSLLSRNGSIWKSQELRKSIAQEFCIIYHLHYTLWSRWLIPVIPRQIKTYFCEPWLI